MVKRKTSPLWNHFENVLPGKKAKCNYCSRELVISPNSIGSLRRHMKKLHPTIQVNNDWEIVLVPDVYDNSDVNAEPSPSCSGENYSQALVATEPPSSPGLKNWQSQETAPSMEENVTCKRIIIRPRKQQIDEQLVRMITRGYHALRLIDDAEFRKFVEMLHPKYNLPTRKSFLDNLLPKAHKKVLENVRQRIAKASAICITADAWTSVVNDGYIAVTAHFIDTEMHKLSTFMLGCIEFEEKHTADNLKSSLSTLFSEWNIEEYINVIVNNNAANVLSAIRLGGWPSLTCYAHTINSVVQSSITEISDTVHRVRTIVEYFHKSKSAKKRLSEMQGNMKLSPLKPMQAAAIRWNSTYDMLVRILEIKEALIATLETIQPDLNLSENDWTIIEKATEILRIFNEVTTDVGDEEYVSASKYIVYCKIIHYALNKYEAQNENIRLLLNSLKSQMEQRFGDVESNMLLCEATILDPRFKRTGFRDPRNFDKAVTALKLRIEIEAASESIKEEPVSPAPPTSGESSSIWDEFDAETSVLVARNQSAGVIEFEKYILEPPISRTENPLLWWNERKGTIYPQLYNYMLKRLNITATSVPCEQVFSKAGLLLNGRQARLKTKKLPQLLFVSCNQ